MKGDLIERALQDVSDGKPVDWDLLVVPTLGVEDREQLKWLRVLDEIAELYRSIPDSAAADRKTGRDATPPAMPNTSHATWGRYQLLEKVGEGGFGSVHRAWDPQLECEVAIKILHQRDADHRLTQRLLDEGRALAKIRHPNVVRVLGVESNESRVGLCMDFVRGQTLGDLVRTQGSLSADEAALVGRDVCAALAAVHRAGFVHRDVKAGNVMREQAGRIVLMDFGAGREFSTHDGAQKRDMTGTPSYMAPEVLAREPASTRSDVYSVGVLLYYLVTAEYPVPARTIDELRVAHREGKRRSLSERRPDLPGPFVRVVERALAVNPDERYPHAGAFLDALGSVAGGDMGNATNAASKLLPLPFVAVVIAGIAVSFACALGALNSAAFNHSLGLDGFSAETLWDYVVWGFKSIVLPAVLITFAVAMAWFLASPAYVLRHFLTTRSSHAATVDQAVRSSLRRGAGQLGLDDAATLSSVVLWLSAASLAGFWTYFWPMMRSCLEPIAGAPAAQLALLSPAFLPAQNLYRTMFTGLVVVVVLSWYMVLMLASRQGTRVSRSMLTGGAAVLVLTVATLDFPYRVLRYAEFEAARWNGEMCYITGERAADFLLFCPEIQPPRNRVVLKDAGSVERLGVRENIFVRFSPRAQ